MKALLLLYRGNPHCGGQGIYLYNLSRELAKLGVEVDILVGPPYPEPTDKWSKVYRVENLNMWSIKTKDIPGVKLARIYSPWNFIDYLLTRFHVFPEIETFSMRAFFLLNRLIKKNRYDIIHDINTLGWGNILMKNYNIPIISTIHHPLSKDLEADLMQDHTFWDKLTTRLFYPLVMQRFVAKRIDRIITSFKEGIKELNSAFGVSKNKISIVYNGIDIEMFRNTGEPREENSLLFVGNTEDFKKGLIYLLKALLLLPEDINLTIVDEGPPGKLYAAEQIKKLGLQHRVTITGKLDSAALVSLYSSKTILVMASLFEGFGLPAVEALACNTPVVATDAGALKEVLNDECGILVPPRNPERLKEAILKLLGDARLRERMGKYGREWVEKNFSWESAANNTFNVYKDVIKNFRGER